ncbi:hypothetical protein ACJ72_07956 [Emergomyces africanus]|uniref:Uncharacterized protein n=1 Tax=Emergomyces africanus TaxID=1955775 RepID=A0A1B7NLT5_9EURO|nr:hypothetical protein ACJ72_07956 [Emergomyces africanus]
MTDNSSPDYKALYHKAEAERRQAEEQERHEEELRRQAEERERHEEELRRQAEERERHEEELRRQAEERKTQEKIETQSYFTKESIPPPTEKYCSTSLHF